MTCLLGLLLLDAFWKPKFSIFRPSAGKKSLSAPGLQTIYVISIPGALPPAENILIQLRVLGRIIPWVGLDRTYDDLQRWKVTAESLRCSHIASAGLSCLCMNMCSTFCQILQLFPKVLMRQKKKESPRGTYIVTFCRNWSHLAFQTQQSYDNAVCRRRFNTVLTCSRTVFPGLCKHDTSQSNTNPLCLIRALLAHCDWITPIIWEHICLLYWFYSFTTGLSQWKKIK